jgi:hypothetical protein
MLLINTTTKQMHIGKLDIGPASSPSLSIHQQDRLWPVSFHVHKALLGSKSLPESLHLWHARMGHQNVTDLKQSLKAATGVNIPKNSPILNYCPQCVMAKLHRSPAPCRQPHQYSESLHIGFDIQVHDVLSYDRHKYALILTVRNFNYRVVYPLRNKSETTTMTIYFIQHIEKVTTKSVTHLCSDQGGENVTTKLKDFCRSHGITIDYSATNRHTHNAQVENSIRTMSDSFRASCTANNVDPHYWCDGLPEQARIHNRTLHGTDTMTPYEHIFGHKPDLSFQRVPFCMAFVCVLDKNRQGMKSGIRAHPARYLGFAKPDGHPHGIIGWKFAINDDPKHIIISADAYFVENTFNLTDLLQTSTDTLRLSIHPSTTPEQPTMPDVININIPHTENNDDSDLGEATHPTQTAQQTQGDTPQQTQEEYLAQGEARLQPHTEQQAQGEAHQQDQGEHAEDADWHTPNEHSPSVSPIPSPPQDDLWCDPTNPGNILP